MSSEIPLGWCWGEQNPTQGESPETWQTWTTEAGAPITVTGDFNWGMAILGDDAAQVSRVVYLSDGTWFITVTIDRYQTGFGTRNVYVRGSTTQNRTWTYMQIKVEEGT